MKKLFCCLTICFLVLSGLSQNCFEVTIPPQDGVFHCAQRIIETDNHGYIVSCPARYVYQNDMLVLLSQTGEVVIKKKFQIEDKNLKYCALFKHPQYTNDYLAIAVLVYGDSNTNYTQRDIAFIRLDAELNVVDYNIWNLDEDYLTLATVSYDFPRFIMENDGTLVMAAHCLKTDGYCYLFARINTQGDVISSREDASMNEKYDYLYSFFLRNRQDKSYGMIKFYNHDSGGDFYYHIDSLLNCERKARLTAMELRVVQPPQQSYADTTYVYKSFGGNGEYFNDTSFLITSSCHFYGLKFGFSHHLTLLNDSCEVLRSREWDRVLDAPSNQSFTLSAMTKALCVTDDAIYHCGTTGMKNHWLTTNSGTETSYPIKITVSKYDRDMNLVWRRHYGNDGYYDLYSIYATSDGGCIITGVYAIQEAGRSYKFNSYILKLDDNGYNAVEENMESVAKPYFCYPNPANDYLHIELSPDVSCQFIEIYSIDGRLVETFHETSVQPTIDISGFNAGMYIVKIRMADGKEYSERIVK